MDLYLRRSPVFHAGNLKTPTLILHGEKDFRVPVPQAQELYAALKKNGVPVQLTESIGRRYSADMDRREEMLLKVKEAR